MSELEIALRNEIEELRNEIEELRYMFKAFAEQLWKVVFNDILKQPVPNGVDLRELV